MKKIATSLLIVFLSIVNVTPVMAKTATTDLDFVQIIGDVSDANYNRAITNYCKVPKNVRESFQINGWTLSISTENLEDTWFAGMGYTAVASGYDSALKEIRLENTKNGSNAVVHEMGHYVDGQLGYVSGTDEWKQIWTAEYTTKYGSTSPLEGFAESFEQTILHGASYAKTHPLSYTFCTNACSQIQGLPDEQ